MSGVYATPRPVPTSRVPALGGTAVVALALPVFLIADWRFAGWAIAAGLWVAYQVVGVLLSRIPTGIGNLGGAGIVAFGRMTRAVVLVGVLIAVAIASRDVGLPAAAVYGLAFSVEFALSLLAYFAEERKT